MHAYPLSFSFAVFIVGASGYLRPFFYFFFPIHALIHAQKISKSALWTCFRRYAPKLLPLKPEGFFRARRPLSSLLGDSVSEAGDARPDPQQLLTAIQKLAKEGHLQARNGLKLTYSSSPPLPATPGKKTTISITLVNEGSDACALLDWDVLLRPTSETQLENWPLPRQRKQPVLAPGGSMTFTMQYHPTSVGFAPCLCVVAVCSFHLALVLPLEAASTETLEMRATVLPIIRRKKIARQPGLHSEGPKPTGIVLLYVCV